MRQITDVELANAVRKTAHRMTGATDDYDPLMDLVGDARFALLGEASHGTHDFYHERAQTTQRLIREKGFTAVAVEADWPDAYRIDRYVRGADDQAFAVEALADFRRFPTWMWRNTDVVEFLDWLREHNDALASGAAKTGFYGLDLYSLHSSMEAVLRFLETVDPEAAKRARERYSCFDHFGADTQVYGFLTGSGVTKSCEEQVVSQLVELQRHAMEDAKRDDRVTEDDAFYAEQNARLVKNPEAYYRSMFFRNVSSWNLRDHHMRDARCASRALRTAGHPREDRRLGSQLSPRRRESDGYGSAREAERRAARTRALRPRRRAGGLHHASGGGHGASDWGGPAERKRVRAALFGSYEAIFQATRLDRFLLTLREGGAATEGLREPRLERAIGVIYRPETERASHYFHARLPDQFDVLIHFDETRAVEPLERTGEWEKGEVPETFPFGV